jgi:hypothetical protein
MIKLLKNFLNSSKKTTPKKQISMENQSSSFENKTRLVLKHLQFHKKITSWEAITKYQATRLAAIIFRLKEEGHNITTEMVHEDKKRWAVYHYHEASRF